MRFGSASEIRTNSLSQLLRRKQTVGFHYSPLAMHPLWLNWVKPGTLCRQKERQDAYPLVFLLDLLVVLANPGAHLLASMPRGIIQRLGSQAALPCLCNWVQHHSRNWVVMSLTGRPVTKRISIFSRAGSSTVPSCHNTL